MQILKQLGHIKSFEFYKHCFSWTRDESKSILSEFFVTDENEGESTVIERLRKCQTDLTSTSKESRRDALNTICDVIMVRIYSSTVIKNYFRITSYRHLNYYTLVFWIIYCNIFCVIMNLNFWKLSWNYQIKQLPPRSSFHLPTKSSSNLFTK